MIKEVKTPVDSAEIMHFEVGDMFYISGCLYCGRDAVLPRIVQLYQEHRLESIGVNLHGGVIFHTAVSPAGVGPTSSNKLEIENSMGPLSKGGIRIHLGKGAISLKTVKELEKHHAIYAVIPPVTALLEERTVERSLIAFPELGMEALYRLKVNKYPAIVAASYGRSIYDQ